VKSRWLQGERQGLSISSVTSHTERLKSRLSLKAIALPRNVFDQTNN
jgi:hypothetical protein